MSYSTYIMTNKPRGVLYIGVTSNLAQRVLQHKQKKIDGFTQQYNISQLVWVQTSYSIREAITLEKRLKKWNRQWKIELIESKNPNWHDLSQVLFNID
ncbi:MAG: GIY-YIG nuclease family protein [Epsilonproteobacteria bacterium]|nr:GIY-YIG nuclease family protein [Campylobacterota bacterium]